MSLADMVSLLPVMARASRRDSGTPRKITADVALAISRDPASLSRLAKRHGLSRSTVSRIKRGLLWAGRIRELTDKDLDDVRTVAHR